MTGRVEESIVVAVQVTDQPTAWSQPAGQRIGLRLAADQCDERRGVDVVDVHRSALVRTLGGERLRERRLVQSLGQPAVEVGEELRKRSSRPRDDPTMGEECGYPD